MKTAFILFLLALLITLPAVAQDIMLPPFYTVSDVVETSPSVEAGVPGGMFNPAVLGLSRLGEGFISWNDVPKLDVLDRNLTWGLDLNGLGFSMSHWNYTDTTGASPVSRNFNDFQIGMGFGEKESRFGMAYGWSKGDLTTLRPRGNTFTLGYLGRPFTQLSYGSAVTFGKTKDDVRGVVDVGVRPFGTPLVTLFGDASMGRKDRFKDVLWSAGASIEPLQGIALRFKAFDGGSYTLGLSITGGQSRLSATPRYDKDGNLSYTTYSVRAGAFQKGNFLDKTTPKLLPKKISSMQYVKLNFDGPIKYRRFMYFDEGGHTLVELLENLEMVKNDPYVGGLAIKITEDMYGSWEMLWEIREKLKEVKASGKKIVVFFERGGMSEYYLASVADKIMIDPESMVTMFGFVMGRTYYKNMLEKLGLGFDEWRFFTYKSANEGFSRTEMSEADKEQRKAIIDGFYETFRKDICESRGISLDDFDLMVNEMALLSADSMIARKLADTTGRWGDMEDYLKSLNEGQEKSMVPMAMLKIRQPESRIWGATPEIAVIYALGPCSMNDGINARRLERVIKHARDDSNVKAVVFRADSPGGDILPSDIVAQELKKTAEKKPVIVSQGQVAGSGGYWISMYGDKIVASPWTITGSIGVIGGWFWDNGFGAKLGLTFDHTQVGKHADLGRGVALPLIGGEIPKRNLTPEERASMETWIRNAYADFTAKVAAGRKMEQSEVDKVGQGRVWTGTAGKEKGLVDEIGGLETSIDLALEKAKIKPGSDYELKEMPRRDAFDPMMFQPKLVGLTVKSLETDPELIYFRSLLKAEGRPLVMIPPDLLIQ
jgi:protease-4